MILMLIDIDNTLAENAHRTHLLPDWKAFFSACDTDTAIEPIVQVISAYIHHPLIEAVFVTGRQGFPDVKDKTRVWLEQIGMNGKPIHFRGFKDFSKSHIFKQKVLEKIVQSHHAKVVIIDDDIKIIEHFTSLGHVAICIKPDNGYMGSAQQISHTLNALIAKLQAP